MALSDYIDIGVFTGKKDEEKPLYLRKEKITQANQTFEIVVDQMPTRAGIDPYNKLIDRIPDGNIINSRHLLSSLNCREVGRTGADAKRGQWGLHLASRGFCSQLPSCSRLTANWK